MDPSPAEAFASLVRCACEFDPLALLAGLAQRHMFVRAGEFHDEESEIHRVARRIELVAGILLARPRSSLGRSMPAAQDFAQVSDRAEDYLLSLSREIARQSMAEGPSKPWDLASDARIHSLSVRGDAYPHQLYEFARGLYGPHENWFRERLGFTIDEASSIAQAAFSKYEERNCASRQRAAEEFSRRTAALPGEIAPDVAEAIAAAVIEEFHYGFAVENLGLDAAELAAPAGVSGNICERFFARMSQEFGYRNPEHPDVFTNPLRAGWDFSTLCERPFLKDSSRYYMILPSLVATSLYTTFYFDLMKDSGYVNRFNRAKGAWLEGETAAFLRRVFPANMVILNPAYPDGNELCDVLVLYDGIIVIVQCKSKGLRFQSKIGLDAAAIADDFRKAVGDAFVQGIRARDYLTGVAPRIRIGRDREWELDSAGTSAVFIVTVTPLGLQMFATRIANQDAALRISRAGEYPWAVSLADLDVLTDILDSPAKFLHYASRRVELERTSFMFFGDEMDLLGLYLTQGMCFDDERFKGFDTVSISGFSSDVDRYVHEKRVLRQESAKPSSPMPDGFAALLNDLEHSGCMGATNCALALLDHSGRARKELMDGIGVTRERVRQTGKMQRFTAILRNGQLGVSFLGMKASGDRQNLMRQLQSYAILQKHLERCPAWVAMAWDAASPRAVDLCWHIEGPWCEDAELDQLAQTLGVNKAPPHHPPPRPGETS